MRDHVPTAGENRRNELRDPGNHRRSEGLFRGYGKKSRHAKDVQCLKATADSRQLGNRSHRRSHHHQRCRRKREVEVHAQQHEPKLQCDDQPNDYCVTQREGQTAGPIQER